MKTRRNLFSAALAIVIALALSVTAFAAWPQYQGNLAHNGQITNGTPPTSPPTFLGRVAIGTVENESVMQTEEFIDSQGVTHTYTYAYTVHSTSSTGTRLSKTNCNQPGGGPSVGEWDVQLNPSAGFQLASPALIPENQLNAGVYVGVTGFFELLENPQLTTSAYWSFENGASYDGVNQKAVIPENGFITQKFVYDGSNASQSVELFSQVILQRSSVNPGQVDFTITDPLLPPTAPPIYSYTAYPNSTTDWTFITDYATLGMTQNDTYIITVTATTGDVLVDHVDFSYQTNGVEAYDFDGNEIFDIAAPGGGQANTPIVIDNAGQYLYYGTLSAGGAYYQFDIANQTLNATYTSGYREYWAGATIVSINNVDYAVFGSDSGYLHVRLVSDFGGTGNLINLANLASDPGNVRATVSTDGTYIYFTSQGGYLWRMVIASLLTTPAYNILPLPYGSTSTPAISANKYIYVGYYGGPGGAGGVLATPQSTFDGFVEIAPSTVGAVQSSPIVYSTGSDDYIYFTTNVSSGHGYCYYFDTTDPTSISQVWAAGGSNYALQGFAAENGYLVYGDDSGTLFVLYQ
jgi:hypothetical protein